MSFDMSAIEDALDYARGNVEQALDHLLKTRDIVQMGYGFWDAMKLLYDCNDDQGAAVECLRRKIGPPSSDDARRDPDPVEDPVEDID